MLPAFDSNRVRKRSTMPVGMAQRSLKLPGTNHTGTSAQTLLPSMAVGTTGVIAPDCPALGGHDGLECGRKAEELRESVGDTWSLRPGVSAVVVLDCACRSLVEAVLDCVGEAIEAQEAAGFCGGGS